MTTLQHLSVAEDGASAETSDFCLSTSPFSLSLSDHRLSSGVLSLDPVPEKLVFNRSSSSLATLSQLAAKSYKKQN